MKSRLLIVFAVLIIGMMAFIVGVSVASPSINNFDDFVYQLKEPFDGAEPKQIAQPDPDYDEGFDADVPLNLDNDYDDEWITETEIPLGTIYANFKS